MSDRDSTSSPRREVLLRQPRSNQSTAGRLSEHYDTWVSVTDNNFVLQIVKYGLKIHFHTLPPMLKLSSAPFSASRTLTVSAGVSSLYQKAAIAVITPHEAQFVSPIFDVPKKGSSST